MDESAIFFNLVFVSSFSSHSPYVCLIFVCSSFIFINRYITSFLVYFFYWLTFSLTCYFDWKFLFQHRYTDSVMNYQSMVPSASNFAQFYHQAAASAVSAASAVGVGVDSLGKKPLRPFFRFVWLKSEKFQAKLISELLKFCRKLYATIKWSGVNSWIYTRSWRAAAVSMDGVNRW